MKYKHFKQALLFKVGSTFEYRNPQEIDDTVLYAEPTLQGNAAICKRQEGEQETQMNLELLFNAVIGGKLTE